MKKTIFYFWKVINSLLCWWLILSRENKAAVTGYELFFLYLLCVYRYHCEDLTCPCTLQIWTVHKQQHKAEQQPEAGHAREAKIRTCLFKTCASSSSQSWFYSKLRCYYRLARINKSAIFLIFDFIECRLANSSGMFSMTWIFSSCSAWDCFLESSDTFIKSPQKVTLAAN